LFAFSHYQSKIFGLLFGLRAWNEIWCTARMHLLNHLEWVMNKIVVAGLLSFFVATPSIAAQTKGNFGVNISSAGAYGIQAEFDISARANGAPVSAQLFWKHDSQDIGNATAWHSTAIGFAGIYDFTAVTQLDSKVHPYAGAGLMSVSHDRHGPWSGGAYNGMDSGLYFTGGVRYNFEPPQLDVDLNYNNFGDITLGFNLNF